MFMGIQIRLPYQAILPGLIYIYVSFTEGKAIIKLRQKYIGLTQKQLISVILSATK
jgi:predicted benzoate:H+ symporter BenE